MTHSTHRRRRPAALLGALLAVVLTMGLVPTASAVSPPPPR